MRNILLLMRLTSWSEVTKLLDWEEDLELLSELPNPVRLRRGGERGIVWNGFYRHLYSLFCFANEIYGAIVFSSKTQTEDQIVFNNHQNVKTWKLRKASKLYLRKKNWPKTYFCQSFHPIMDSIKCQDKIFFFDSFPLELTMEMSISYELQSLPLHLITRMLDLKAKLENITQRRRTRTPYSVFSSRDDRLVTEVEKYEDIFGNDPDKKVVYAVSAVYTKNQVHSHRVLLLHYFCVVELENKWN